MIMKKIYQKYLLLVFYYPPEWVLRQYILTCQISYFLVFLKCFFIYKKSSMSFRPVFTDHSSSIGHCDFYFIVK